MTYLEEIRAKRTRREPLNDIEEVIWEYYWDYPTNRKEKAERAAEQYLRMVNRIGTLEMDAALRGEAAE